MYSSYKWLVGVFQKIKEKKNLDRVYIRFFIYYWTLIDITLIHSHCIHNHVPIRIIIVIYNFMHVVITTSWPNHPFYHDLVRNIWFSVCKSTQTYSNYFNNTTNLLWIIYINSNFYTSTKKFNSTIKLTRYKTNQLNKSLFISSQNTQVTNLN